MKKIITLIFAATVGVVVAQNTKPANVYPTNLEENMYYEKYDEATSTVKGLYFMVLSDGDNSRDVTPAFEVSLYLMPEGKSSREDIIIIKTYKLDGIYHMGSHEFKNENISLAGVDVQPGVYRLGLWVNSNNAFQENTNDNAMLFKKNIRISKTPSKAVEKKTDDGWGDWGTEDKKEDKSKQKEEEDDDDDWD
jgi:hypothetical protein